MESQNILLDKLLRQVEISIQRNVVSFSDAKFLSEEIAKKKLFVSPHTIGRLYGIVKPSRKPYKATLNILSQFLNYLKAPLSLPWFMILKFHRKLLAPSLFL